MERYTNESSFGKIGRCEAVSSHRTQRKEDITGKQGRKLNSLKRNKAVTVSGTNGLISGGLLETQTGGTFENKKTPVMFPEYLIVKDDKVKTTYKAVGTPGNEIEAVYIHTGGVALGKKFTQAAEEPTTGQFKYDPVSKEITFFADDIDDGTEIAVYYFRNIVADVLENHSDTYSEKVSLYIDAFAEDTCTNQYRIQFYIPKADFDGNFDIEMGDSQAVHAFEAESLSGGCGAGSSSTLWTYTVFGADAEDAE